MAKIDFWKNLASFLPSVVSSTKVCLLTKNILLKYSTFFLSSLSTQIIYQAINWVISYVIFFLLSFSKKTPKKADGVSS